MGYYVKCFGESPLKLKVAKTTNPEIDYGKTPLEAVMNSINYTHKILKDWEKDESVFGKDKTKEQKEKLKHLGELLNQILLK